MRWCSTSEKTFKSYYVVWKQDLSGIEEIICVEFKSYYVVWKLFSSQFLYDMVAKFKSYYVVWKPMYQTHIYYAPRRLNRTM